jgi:uncharacterized membrane protein YjgN (DUF898 family)
MGIFAASWLAYHSLQSNSWVRQILEDHFGALLGVPMAALMAICIVILLRFAAGPIEFKGLGFEFRGASGQIVFWIFCFLAIVSAQKLLW